MRSTVLTANYFDIPVNVDQNYGLRKFLREVVFNEDQRCSICYDMRLKKVAETAAHGGFDAFSTTLLYSRYQDHEKICKQAKYWSEYFEVDFFYQDFRRGWQEGIDHSRDLGLYRQPYCGCIYSEQDRYDKQMKLKIKNNQND